ncbi:protein DMR6-LIKE OXYGENASE 1-like [Silene latifolia]|uniref:protein DMR6-LIKE OXYGENASE 1-like n=1 Tax=Silene latifolia TaxID=37657 RepID=UPI003D775CB2
MIVTFFREVVEEYVRGVKGLQLRLLEHISEGLGLEREYLGGELSEGVALAVNHYPPSPNPDLTVGQPEHTDPTVITIAHGGNVSAFQIIKDGQWFTVETPPQGFLVFMGSQIEVISNGKLKALQHRAASTRETRYTAIFFINPSPECIVEPAKAILEAENSSSLYKSYKYEDFYKAHVGPKPKGKGYFYDDVVEELANKS